MLLHCGIYFLGEIIATMRHVGFLWILSLTALAFAGLFISITLSFFLSNSLQRKRCHQHAFQVYILKKGPFWEHNKVH